MDRTGMILTIAALALLLYEVISGWRQGVVRQLVSIGSLVVAWFGGRALGGAAGGVLRFTGLPDVVLYPLGAILAGVGLYLVLTFLGRILFRKTSEQSLGPIWFLYGAGGAVLGVAFGLVLIWGGLITLRFVGAFASGVAAGSTAEPGKLSRTLTDLRDRINDGRAGEWLTLTDPVSTETYAAVEGWGKVAARPMVVVRYLSGPDASSLGNLPEISALKDDPAIIKAVQEGNYMELLRHPKVVAAMNHPEVMKVLQTVNLEALLGKEGGGAPTPAPHGSPSPAADVPPPEKAGA